MTKRDFFEIKSQNMRILPYVETYQIALTYELYDHLNVIVRSEFTFFDWISNIGGLSFLFSIALLVSTSVDNPLMLVTASML